MFNQGEIAIFRRVGLNPVFFGEAVAGPRMPNLTYLLAFEDDKARTEAWRKFGGDPEWRKLRAIPEYEDKRLVSSIRHVLMTPASCSQIYLGRDLPDMFVDRGKRTKGRKKRPVQIGQNWTGPNTESKLPFGKQERRSPRAKYCSRRSEPAAEIIFQLATRNLAR